MNKTVIWSGGCDSTLILFEAIMNNTSETKIQALSFVHSKMDANKMMAERKARDAFKQKIGQLGWSDRVVFDEITTTTTAEIGHYPCGCPQIALWLCPALLHVPDDTELVFGYIRKDDYWHYILQVCEIVEHASKIMGKKIKLSFPKEWSSKEDIIRDLIHHSIYECTWSCEDPIMRDGVFVPCGKCTPCIAHDAAFKIVDVQSKAVVTADVKSTLDVPYSPEPDLTEKKIVTTSYPAADDAVFSDVFTRLTRAGAQSVSFDIKYVMENGEHKQKITIHAEI